MRKEIVLPAVAVAGGAVAFGLRRWELATAFEADTGLVIPGSPATYVLIAWCLVVAAAIFLLSWSTRATLPYDDAFAARGNTVYLTAAVLSAFLMLASVGLQAISFPGIYQTYQNARLTALAQESTLPSLLVIVLPLLLILLGIVAFLCVLRIAQGHYRAAGNGKESLPLLGLCLMMCVWLAADYHGRAADPVILDYVYEVFAIISVLLGIYFIAGYSFQTGKPRRTIVVALLGVFFSALTLADHHAPADLLLYGFAILFLTAHVALLLHNTAGVVPVESEADTNE